MVNSPHSDWSMDGSSHYTVIVPGLLLYRMALIMLRYIPSIASLLKVFTISGCWILSNTFSVSIDMII